MSAGLHMLTCIAGVVSLVIGFALGPYEPFKTATKWFIPNFILIFFWFLASMCWT